MKVWYVLIKDGKEKRASKAQLQDSADIDDLCTVVVKECKLDVAANELTVYADKKSWDAAKKLKSSAVVQGHTTEDTAYYVVDDTPVQVLATAAPGTYFVCVPFVSVFFLCQREILSCVPLVVIFGCVLRICCVFYFFLV
jgi:hypothetical protein